MKNIVVLGAGLSATSLIKYLLDNSQQNDWKVWVGDINPDVAKKKIDGHVRGNAFQFDVADHNSIKKYISIADLVVSMLPARFHGIIVRECVLAGKHMATASYVTDEIKSLDSEAKKKGLVLLNELGVDPGIDHMSAMKIVDKIRGEKGKITSFYSFTGGLVAPENDNNPWNYKFTWNPRNVVLAGQGVSQFIKNGKYKYIPYHKLFDRTISREVLDCGWFEVYPNRDSLRYRAIYGLDNIQSMFRGTIRRPGFCKAWDSFVQLGCTDDSYTLENSAHMTYRDFINTFLKYEPEKSVERKVAEYIGLEPDGEVMKKLEWLGVFDRKPIGLKNASPAAILQQLLEEKWALDPHDKDMIVMQHEFEYEKNDEHHEFISSLVVKGNSSEETAMSRTVGLPLGIAIKLVLTGQIKQKGVLLPTIPEIYIPILWELESYGIRFEERTRKIWKSLNGMH